MRIFLITLCLVVSPSFLHVANAEEVIWRTRANGSSTALVPDSATTGLGPDFLIADFALAQVFVQCKPGMPRIGQAGTINAIKTFYRNDAQVDFEFLPNAQFNPDTGQFEIPGPAIVNVFVPGTGTPLPAPIDNPNMGIPVNAIFSQDFQNDRIEVRVENLLPQNIVIDENTRYFVGLTPVFFSFDLRPFDGIHLTNDFPEGNENQSAVRQTAPEFGPWFFAGNVFGPPRELFATIEILGPPKFKLGDLNMDDEVNLLDVGPFVDVLSNSKFLKEADINGDGFVNLLDVDGFIQILSGG